MKIIFYRHSLLNRGGDKIVLTHACALADRGHEVTIYVNNVDTRFRIATNIKIKRIEYSKKWGTIWRALRSSLIADVVIADIIVLAVILNIRNRGRTLYLAQDYDIHYYNNLLSRVFIKFLYWLGLKVFGISCIAVSQSLKEELEFYEGRIEVVENGVNLDVFQPFPDKSLLELKDDRNAILILGRKDRRKGLDLALEVLSQYEGENKEVWIVGEKVDLCLPKYIVRNFGYVEERKLAGILSSVDVLLYPTRHEGFGLFVLEALACKCPVVTTEVVKLVKHDQTAWVANVHSINDMVEGITSFLDVGNERERIVENGYTLAQNYDIKKSLIKFEEKVTQLIEGEK